MVRPIYVRWPIALYYAIPPCLAFLFGPGREYGVGFFARCRLVGRFFHNGRRAQSASNFLEHLTLASYLLSLPKSLEGNVAEFGCFKGMSTASLSLVCALTGRRLVVFDSFCGLPEPEQDVTNIVGGTVLDYKKGDLTGTLEEVKQNVARYGDIRCCEFVQGYFEDSLPGRKDESFVMVFEDADLVSSVRTVLQWAWPRLREGCRFYTHEARDNEVMAIFFDNAFWHDHLGVKAPGIVGSGLGLPLGSGGSCLGYIDRGAMAAVPVEGVSR